MAERGITNASLENGIVEGEIIEECSDDMPCPSVLLLSMVNNIPKQIISEGRLMSSMLSR